MHDSYNDNYLISELQRSTKSNEQTGLISEKFRLLYSMFKSLKSDHLNNKQEEIKKLLNEITTLKKEILKIEHQRDFLLLTEEIAVKAGMDAIRKLIYNGVNFFPNLDFIWCTTSYEDFSTLLNKEYQTAFDDKRDMYNKNIEAFTKLLERKTDKKFALCYSGKRKEVESLYFHLSELSKRNFILNGIEETLKGLLLSESSLIIGTPVPFQEEIIQRAIIECIENLKNLFSETTVKFQEFITNFLSPLSTQGFERVKESYYEVIIKENDDFLSLAPLDLESGFTEHDKNVREDAIETINQLMSIKLGPFNENLAKSIYKSIYLELANPDTNSDLQSLTYSQAATIARIIYVNAPNLESDIATTSKIITEISLKILRSQGITQDLLSLVNHIAGSNIAHEDVSSTWNSNLKSNNIHSALDIVKSLADTLTNDTTSIDTAILDYEGIFDIKNIGLNTGCFFNARKKEIRGNQGDGLGNRPLSCIDPK